MISALHAAFPNMRLEEHFMFSRHTTIGTGGSAWAAAYPESAQQTARLIGWLKNNGVPFCFLGAGANVLASDAPFHGVVIRFHALTRMRLQNNGIMAEAGVTGGALLCFASRNGHGGLEALSGIPMTLGGAIAMNAGVQEGHIADFVEQVSAICDGEYTTLCPAECRFAEKSSIFLQNEYAVISAVLRTKRCYSDEILRRQCYFREKRRHLPKGRSMGCIFVNPKGISAGALIERCGLKGARVGRAYVSPQHANFIINEGESSRDIDCLIRTIHTQVERQTGICLREEIQRLP